MNYNHYVNTPIISKEEAIKVIDTVGYYQNIQSNNAITGTVDISPNTTVGDNLKEEIFNMIFSRLSAKPLIKHNCHNCGAHLELDEDKHIFHCPYCDSVYLIGTQQINDVGD